MKTNENEDLLLYCDLGKYTTHFPEIEKGSFLKNREYITKDTENDYGHKIDYILGVSIYKLTPYEVKIKVDLDLNIFFEELYPGVLFIEILNRVYDLLYDNKYIENLNLDCALNIYITDINSILDIDNNDKYYKNYDNTLQLFQKEYSNYLIEYFSFIEKNSETIDIKNFYKKLKELENMWLLKEISNYQYIERINDVFYENLYTFINSKKNVIKFNFPSLKSFKGFAEELLGIQLSF